MSNAFLGQITMFGGNYAPRNTAFCNGQTLGIAQNTALFSLLGTTYGGNGSTTFMLPNLQSRVSIHQGQGTGLSAYTLGQTAGSASVTINQSTLPIHQHALNATQAIADSPTIASNKLPGQPTVGNPPAFYAFQGPPPLPTLVPHPMNAAACSTVGGSQGHSNLMPSQCITFVIFLQGIFPSRN
jgi:microcystin-dependent protein